MTTKAEQNGVSVLDNLDPEAPRFLELRQCQRVIGRDGVAPQAAGHYRPRKPTSQYYERNRPHVHHSGGKSQGRKHQVRPGAGSRRTCADGRCKGSNLPAPQYIVGHVVHVASPKNGNADQYRKVSNEEDPVGGGHKRAPCNVNDCSFELGAPPARRQDAPPARATEGHLVAGKVSRHLLTGLSHIGIFRRLSGPWDTRIRY